MQMLPYSYTRKVCVSLRNRAKTIRHHIVRGKCPITRTKPLTDTRFQFVRAYARCKRTRNRQKGQQHNIKYPGQGSHIFDSEGRNVPMWRSFFSANISSIAKFGVYSRTEHTHRRRQAHIGIHKRRYIYTPVAYCLV